MSGFLASLPGACAQGIIWGIMAVGVYLTFKVLDLADLTVDGSFGTGGAVLVVCTIADPAGAVFRKPADYERPCQCGAEY